MVLMEAMLRPALNTSISSADDVNLCCGTTDNGFEQSQTRTRAAQRTKLRCAGKPDFRIAVLNVR